MTERRSHILSPEQLFLATIGDLERRVLSYEPYEILGIAGLIRKLFLDERSLVDQINREHRVKIEFTLLSPVPVERLRENQSTYFDVGDSLNPDCQALTPGEIRRVKRDAFFATVIIFVWDETITIQDVVTFEANVAGGVHAPNPPKKRGHQTLDELRSQVIVRGHSVSLYHLQNIGKLVRNALQPLRALVEQSTTG